MKTLRWEQQACLDEDAAALARAIGVPPLVARLLCLRGLGDPEEASRFLSPKLEHLHDPSRLTDLDVAVERLMGAIARRERVAVHGDYDVDGVTSTVILRRAMEMLGGDVVHFLPDRLRDCYGLQVPAVERLHAEIEAPKAGLVQESKLVVVGGDGLGLDGAHARRWRADHP